MTTAFGKPLTKQIHPHTRRRRARDLRYVNRVNRYMRARRRVPEPADAPFAYDRRGRPLVPKRPRHVDEATRVQDLMRHGAMLSDDAYRIVAYSRFADGWGVSTVWLGVNMGHRSVPLIFETLVTTPYGEYECRTPTERYARITHYVYAASVQAMYRAHVAGLPTPVTPPPGD
jgi:hypothetical protein